MFVRDQREEVKGNRPKARKGIAVRDDTFKIGWRVLDVLYKERVTLRRLGVGFR